MDTTNKITGFLKGLKTAFAVFDKEENKVLTSSFFDYAFGNFPDFFSFLGVKSDNPAIIDGITVEKNIVLNGVIKTFAFFLQKTESFFFVLAIDITYNTELIASVIKESERIANILSFNSVGIYTKKMNGDFEFKNSAFDKVLDICSYPDSSLIDVLLEKKEVLRIRLLNLKSKQTFVFECAQIVDCEDGQKIEGLVLLDEEFSEGVRAFFEKERMLERIAEYSSHGIMLFSGKGLLLKFMNKAAMDFLSENTVEMLERVGFYDSDILFDFNTLNFVRDSLSFYGRCELLNYKIVHREGEFDFEIVSGEDEIILFFKKVVPIAEKEAFRQFTSMFEYATDAIFLMKDNVFVECNKKAEELFGYKKEEIIGKSPFKLSPEFQPDGMPSEEAAYKMIDNAVQSGNEVFEWVHKKKDGSLFDAEVTLSRFQIGGYTYTQAIVRDISDRKKAISLGKLFQRILKENNPVFVLDHNFRLVLRNFVNSPFTEEEVKKYVISFLTIETELGDGFYGGTVKKGKKEYLCEIKVIGKGKNKFFIVRFSERA